MASHSSTLAWKIPWTEEPGRLQSMGSLRVRYDWATSLSLSCIGEGNGNPLQCSCLENPRDRGAWWASVYGVTESQTRLKRLSSSSSSKGFSRRRFQLKQSLHRDLSEIRIRGAWRKPCLYYYCEIHPTGCHPVPKGIWFFSSYSSCFNHCFHLWWQWIWSRNWHWQLYL